MPNVITTIRDPRPCAARAAVHARRGVRRVGRSPAATEAAGGGHWLHTAPDGPVSGDPDRRGGRRAPNSQERLEGRGMKPLVLVAIQATNANAAEEGTS